MTDPQKIVANADERERVVRAAQEFALARGWDILDDRVAVLVDGAAFAWAMIQANRK